MPSDHCEEVGGFQEAFLLAFLPLHLFSKVTQIYWILIRHFRNINLQRNKMSNLLLPNNQNFRDSSQ